MEGLGDRVSIPVEEITAKQDLIRKLLNECACVSARDLIAWAIALEGMAGELRHRAVTQQ